MQHFFGENLEERKNAKGLLAPSELGDPKPNELKVIKSDQITLPPIVKHVLAPQNEIGMPKTTWSNYKRSWIWVDPPPCSFKIPTFPVYFLQTSLTFFYSIRKGQSLQNVCQISEIIRGNFCCSKLLLQSQCFLHLFQPGALCPSVQSGTGPRSIETIPGFAIH